jgi:glycerol-3-phosphate dehydrogenase (NAD+)
LPKSISATSSIDVAMEGIEALFLAIPAQSVPNWLLAHKDKLDPNLLICNTAKGLYLKDKILLSTAIQNTLGRDQPYALLSGPSFAKEIMQGFPTAVVVASKYLYHAVAIQRMLSSLIFRVYTRQGFFFFFFGSSYI